MTHVRTSPYYPQSNGKIESWHKTVKRECIRPLTPLNLNDARRIVRGFVQTYNTRRLHSGVGDVTPQARLEGLDGEIMVERRRKWAAAMGPERLERLIGREGVDGMLFRHRGSSLAGRSGEFHPFGESVRKVKR